jgi:acyl dehydratase
VVSSETEVWPSGAPEVGDTARRSRKVTTADIERFTAISGDRNPLHYDEEAARASRFGEIVVQGGVSTAILNAVVAENLPGPGTVFLNVTWDFRAPVRPGDTITGEVEIVDVRHDKPITHLRTRRRARRRCHRGRGHRSVLHDANGGARTVRRDDQPS